ncbi:MAG: thiolase family protein [Candidatus Abyssobacteria bacterium SURF_17]|jgi:acetyl-CoA acetyltransferase family protein|uniref:acetyl-CoA C-acyltransferase n=1 Tax=Candidatus Abyssobacteria bacterium SURF_17 TaxID=2093361 RepID=A0A419F1W1_9BACT|nr:MAG: thiolase family protein [Candidatus Abyssubacteria bacterium SURF_17]
MRDVAIVEALRSPIGRSGERGILRDLTGLEIASQVVAALLKKTQLDPRELDDIYCGTIAGPIDSARSLVFYCGLPVELSGLTMNRQCGSSLSALCAASDAIKAGNGDCILVVGLETMGRLGPWSPEDQEMARKLRQYYYAAASVPNGDGKLHPTVKLPDLIDPSSFSMGLTAENLSAKHGITRQEADEFALWSQMKAKKALEEKKFAREMVPVTIDYNDGTKVVIDKDQCPRPESTLEKMAQVKPAFKEGGLVTAANSCPTNDGAAAVLLMAREKAEALGYKALAYVRHHGEAGVPPEIMGIGPIPSTQKLLKRQRMAIDDFDIFELNEAFACQALHCARQLNMNFDKLNVNGGAVALGHPTGATGARFTATLIHEMNRRDAQWGLATMCCGIGQGVACAYERV